MTYKDEVFSILEKKFPKGLSCAEICSQIAKNRKLDKKKTRYLSGSISSILNVLYLASNIDRRSGQSIRGGYVYYYTPFQPYGTCI